MCDRQHEHLARPRGLFENLFSLESEVAIVTGGLGFLGSKYVELIAAAGAKVGIFDKTNGNQDIRCSNCFSGTILATETIILSLSVILSLDLS